MGQASPVMVAEWNTMFRILIVTSNGETLECTSSPPSFMTTLNSFSVLSLITRQPFNDGD
ncbi:hypothetical protein HanIR_Chr08g0368091 [Helianthus annuus]|nr:hypothetical protein HanIR_Chr08g0368091 [Helianthus annuus]KAJ0553671.1 hypothetical protein HanHA89_Chr08g0298941 [Helianthus annuus]KAJ0719332.1 hypothetical protein HanLR1_Chr08g0280481 [Helianthus annuus]